MSAFESARGATPRGAAKLLALNWALILLLAAVASAGFLMLYSVAGGALQPWARPQMIRFGIGIAAMIGIAMIHIRFWRAIAPLAYLGTFALLILVEIMGEIGMGAQRWIDLGFFQLQPSELMKIALVMALAAYYDWLDPAKVSRPLWVILPLLLILAPTAL
ncbi:MAG: FtsW/RodA/SpoVE family cell cycle protein, partial [Rhodobacteraceae bacterium]|nr:FtsW/RodA/SpoVE family cell cycle protein [Paracoccaceae bacterium]MCB1402867.1 FtsW/RodA/SpoVE family cell cycle protein [Paracoccaceae bacterium]